MYRKYFYLFIVTFGFLTVLECTFSDSISFLGSTGGTIRDIAVYEDVEAGKTYLYVAQGAAIIVYDVSDYQNPVEVNRIVAAPSEIYNMTTSDKLLSVSCGVNGTKLYSLNYPAVPSLVMSNGTTSHGAYLSGNLLYILDRTSGSGGPGHRCFLAHYILNINDINNPISIDDRSICGQLAAQFQPTFLYAADTQNSAPNIFWIYNRAFQEVIWNSPSGIGLPEIEMPDIDTEYFPSTMIQWPHSEYGRPQSLVAYQDRVFVAIEDRVLVYDPLIIDSTPEVEVIETGVISGSLLLDQDVLYVPVDEEYIVYDLEIDSPLEMKLKIPAPSFLPLQLKNEVAFGINSGKVMIQHLYETINQLIVLKPEDITVIKSDFADPQPLRPYDVNSGLHPKYNYNIDLSIVVGDFSINLTDAWHDLGGPVNYKILFIENVSDPDNPVYVEGFYVNQEIEPIAERNGSILSFPAGDSGTFHFLLDDALLGTSVDEWHFH